jgi:hypothetical protein
MQSETRLRTYLGVWVSISRTGKEPFKLQPDRNCLVPALQATNPLENTLDFTLTGTSWYWKAGLPATTASSTCRSVPNEAFQLVRRCGAYSGKVRNQRQQRSGIYHLAPEAWKQAHQLRTRSIPEAEPVSVDSTNTPDALSRLRRQSWARLLRKVYDVDPFICPKCQGTMTVVAIIEDPAEPTKIIEWANIQEQEPLMSICARSPPESALVPI